MKEIDINNEKELHAYQIGHRDGVACNTQEWFFALNEAFGLEVRTPSDAISAIEKLIEERITDTNELCTALKHTVDHHGIGVLRGFYIGCDEATIVLEDTKRRLQASNKGE